MRPDTFGNTKASIHLAEELTKDNNKSQSNIVSKQLTELGYILNELKNLKNIRIKKYFARILREEFINKAIHSKTITNETVRSFYRNIIKAKIIVWIKEEENKK